MRLSCTLCAFVLISTSLHAQAIELDNLDGIPYPDRLAFSRIGLLSSPPTNGVHERAVLRIRNTGSASLAITDLVISGTDPASFTVENPPILPVAILPGAFLDLTVRFVAESVRKVHSATLSIASNDPLTPTRIVELSGYWQSVSENNKEASLSQIIEVFGYTTVMVDGGQSLNGAGKILAAGDEVISPYWRRANTSEPVTVRQLAAWHTYPENHGIFWHYKGSTTTTLIVRHNGEDSQSVLPRRVNSTTLPAQGTFSPSTVTAGGVFGFRVQSNEWSDPALNNKTKDDCSGGTDTCGHHVRFWPVKDRQGNIVPNTFILSMDFAGINYDYNDNVYLISNITPADPVAGLADVRINAGGPALTTGGVPFLANMYSFGGAGWTPQCSLGDIAGTTDDDLYRTEWSEAVNFSYRIPAIAGSYLVRLHFAEIAHGNCSGSAGGPGKRVFDVSLEGSKVLENFDISAEVPAVTALIKSFQVEMRDGILNLDFLSTVDFPMVSAIEVLPTANKPPVASFDASPLTGNAPPLNVSFDASSSFDTDGTITSYFWSLGDGATATGPTVSHEYLTPGTFTARLTVTDDAFSSASTAKVITIKAGASNPFAESGGLVVMEAENFHENLSRSSKSWTTKNSPGNVDKSMRAEPVSGQTINTGYAAASPEMQYFVRFNTTGTYYLWARALAPDNTMDSWHYGLNGQAVATADRVNMGSPFGSWRWINGTLDGPVARIQINTPGEHVVSVFMREDGVYIDRILLTTDAAFIPSGNGPPESSRAPTGGNLAPSASFTAMPASGQAPVTISFDAGASSDSDGSIASYVWDFNGDAIVDTTVSTPLITFDYNLKGTYTVTLWVVDNMGASAAGSTTVEVSPVDFTDVTWSTVRANPLGRTEGFGGFANDGRLYLFGGYFGDPDVTPSRRVDAYNPATNLWQQRADLPIGLSHAGVAVDGNDIYFAGGYPEQADGTGQDFSTSSVWKYNILTDTYTALPPLPAPRGGGALVLNGRTLHYFGGSNSARNDVGTHWTFALDGGTSWATAPALPLATNHLGGAALDGKVYAVGGQTGQDVVAIPRATVNRFDPATGVWIEVASLPKPLSHINATTFTMGSRIIVAGGDAADHKASNGVYAYHPATNAWEILTPLPVARLAGVADDFGGHIYFSTGSLAKATYKGVPHPVFPNSPPTAGFLADPTGGNAPLNVNFDASASSDPDGSIVSFSWNFGDGTGGASGANVSHTYQTGGSFVVTLIVTDDQGDTGSATLTIDVFAPHFEESDGRVVIEAENFIEKIDRGSHAWISHTKTGSVGEAMLATPNAGVTINTGFVVTSPEVRYNINFGTTGTYYVWARVWGETQYDDSYHAGLNGQAVATADRISLQAGERKQWFWLNLTLDGGTRAAIPVTSGGIKSFSAWMREDGLVIDRFVLTIDPDFTPTGEGPPESTFNAGESGKTSMAAKDAMEVEVRMAGDLAHGDVPDRYALEGSYPNPFNPVTTIAYAIPEEVHVALDVFDLLGRHVISLVDEVQKPGRYRARFDGGELASGVYIFRLQAGPFAQVSHVVLVK